MRRGATTTTAGQVRPMDHHTPPSNRFRMQLERGSGEIYTRRHKRMKVFHDGNIGTGAGVVDYSDPFAVPNLMEELRQGIYGSVTKEIEALRARRAQLLNPVFALYPSLSSTHGFTTPSVGADDRALVVRAPETPKSIIIVDSDEEDGEERHGLSYLSGNNMLNAFIEANRKASQGHKEAHTRIQAAANPIKDLVVTDFSKNVVREDVMAEVSRKESRRKTICEETLGGEPSEKPKGEYVGVQDDSMSTGSPQSTDDDGLEDEWREMALALECAKDDTPQTAAVASSSVPAEEGDECEHSYILKDDLGYVCRICGVVKKQIELIFDFQWVKGTKTSRTYASESRSSKDRELEEAQFSFSNTAEEGLNVAEISVHPRHYKQMKPHQLEGFNFLRRKLVSDKPSGCILAHAPGSGKTFMIISFMQSFLAKYPNARPLVVLPKGIVGTWKREFLRWQVEEVALYDFYSVKANNRAQQLDVLKEWVQNRGILFLGYKQFANIVSDSSTTSSACHDILLQVPTILILDEGHTPRNETTDVLHSLSKVQTPRKVVLSGTLFQNHVKEVFNIVNLVCPKFLKSETSKAIVRRVLSRVQISGTRKQTKSGMESLFFDSVEETLQNDEDFRRKVLVIQDLREMTKDVLHYYKGDFLEELPGFVDLTVLLNLSPIQKKLVDKLKKLEKFKRTSQCNAVYVHPRLKDFAEKSTAGDKSWNVSDDKIDAMLDALDVKEGVKAKFFLSLLGLCESSGEKILVFSQYLTPLKFFERLLVRTRGWSFGKEIFEISGDITHENRERYMDQFNNSPDAKVLFGSIKACGEGISLVGASRLLILDVHLNPSVTRQAIGRAFRPGQLKKVYSYRLVAADSPEEEDHATCFRKELIAKMWFEWTEYCGDHDFAMEKVEAKEIGDTFWESPLLREDVQDLFKR